MIRIRTQYPNITFCVKEDGELLMNGTPVGRLFPDEYHMIAMAVEEANEQAAEALGAAA